MTTVSTDRDRAQHEDGIADDPAPGNVGAEPDVGAFELDRIAERRVQRQGPAFVANKRLDRGHVGLVRHDDGRLNRAGVKLQEPGQASAGLRVGEHRGRPQHMNNARHQHAVRRNRLAFELIAAHRHLGTLQAEFERGKFLHEFLVEAARRLVKCHPDLRQRLLVVLILGGIEPAFERVEILAQETLGELALRLQSLEFISQRVQAGVAVGGGLLRMGNFFAQGEVLVLERADLPQERDFLLRDPGRLVLVCLQAGLQSLGKIGRDSGYIRGEADDIGRRCGEGGAGQRRHGEAETEGAPGETCGNPRAFHCGPPSCPAARTTNCGLSCFS